MLEIISFLVTSIVININTKIASNICIDFNDVAKKRIFW